MTTRNNPPISFPGAGYNASKQTQSVGMNNLQRLFNKVRDTGDAPFNVYVDELSSVTSASRVYFTQRKDTPKDVIVDFNKLFLSDTASFVDKVDERSQLNSTAILGLLLVESGYLPTFKAMTATSQACLLESIAQWARVKPADDECALCTANLIAMSKTGKHYVSSYSNVCYMCIDELESRLARAYNETGTYNTEYMTYFQTVYLKENKALLETLIDIVKE